MTQRWRNSADAAAERRGHTGIFQSWFGIDPAAAKMLDRLYAAGGEMLPYERLMALLDTGLEGVRRRAFVLHQAMDPGSLVCETRLGYRLMEIGRADCDRGIADHITLSEARSEDPCKRASVAL